MVIEMTDLEKEKQDYRKTMMLKEPLPKVITKMAVPSIIAFLITSTPPWIRSS